MVSKAIETAQRRVEGHNFDIRKQLLEYDNTMNRQREVIYEQRRRILEGVNLQGLVRHIIAEVAEGLVDTFAPKDARPDAWDLAGLREAAAGQFGLTLTNELESADRETIADGLIEAFERAYDGKRASLGPEVMDSLERTVLLSIIDAKWKDHLYMMDALREGIHLRAYGQRDPLVEYQREGYGMFQDLIASIKTESLMMLLRLVPRAAAPGAAPSAPARPQPVFDFSKQQLIHQEAPTFGGVPAAEPGGAAAAAPVAPVPAFAQAARPQAQPAAASPTGQKVGRNEPCPCGSGLKYKKCHGK
jgi:preprotein translocase subunit SecA